MVDATVALAAASLNRAAGVTVVTSDPDDIRRLTDVLQVEVRLQRP